MKVTNKKNLSLPMAVLFSHQDYDYDNSEKTLSATRLMKPLRAIVLNMITDSLDGESDLTDFIPAVFGSAVHSFAEDGWKDRATVVKAMKAMGIREETIRKIVINPKEMQDGSIPIYVEKRSSREINGWTIRGKFDGCVDGKLFDYKTQSVWAQIFGSNDEDYKLQGSIYKWLNPTIVFADNISIEKIFTDWSSSKARADSNYPQLRVMSKDYELMSLQETENWIVSKLAQIDANLNKEEKDIPQCKESELWMSESIWKYYKKPGAARATKNYKSVDEANKRLAKEGCGEIVSFPGEVKRCKYCNVQPVCSQASKYIEQGRLRID